MHGTVRHRLCFHLPGELSQEGGTCRSIKQQPVDNYVSLREKMVREQLLARDIADERVLTAMRQIPREQFVPLRAQCDAYWDGPLKIGYGQTISQPYMVALMAEIAGIDRHARVLEVGTGSGYGAAVLSKLAYTVHTIERIPQLARAARQTLRKLGYENVDVCQGNGKLGLPECAPFDAIIVTAASRSLPEAYVPQLVETGRIVIPIGRTRGRQRLYRFSRCGPDLHCDDFGPVRFVPLK